MTDSSLLVRVAEEIHAHSMEFPDEIAAAVLRVVADAALKRDKDGFGLYAFATQLLAAAGDLR